MKKKGEFIIISIIIVLLQSPLATNSTQIYVCYVGEIMAMRSMDELKERRFETYIESNADTVARLFKEICEPWSFILLCPDVPINSPLHPKQDRRSHELAHGGVQAWYAAEDDEGGD